MYLNNKKKEYQTVIINKKIDNTDNYLKLTLHELNKLAPDSFQKMLKRTYPTFFYFFKAGIKTTLQLVGISFLDYLVDFFLDSTKIFCNKKNEEVSKEQVLYEYIRDISLKEKLLIVFDNFMYCDSNSFDILLRVIKRLSNKHITKFILILTTDRISNEKNYIEIFSKLDTTCIEIKKFPNFHYFYIILCRLINNTYLSIDFVKELYEICEGNPQKLQFFLTKIFLNNEQSNFINILKNLKIDIARHYFNHEINLNIYQMSILIIFICLKYPLCKKDLMNIVYNTLSGINHVSINKETINKNIDILIDSNILKITYQLFDETITFSHDSVYVSIEELLKNNYDFSNKYDLLIYQSLLNYLLDKPNYFYSLGFTNIKLKEIIAKVSYLCNNPMYIKYNLEYIKLLVKNNKFQNTTEAILRLHNDIKKLNDSDILFLINTHYLAGCYNFAKKLSDIVQIDSFDYFLLKAKIYSILQINEDAITFCELAEKYTVNQDMQLRLINIKISALHEIPGREPEARALFMKFKENFDNKQINCKSEVRLLKTAEDYLPMKEAEKYMKKAIEISQILNERVLEGMSIHNMGVIFFRQNHYKSALNEFYQALNILKIYQPHEISYTLNNIGVIQMLNEDYDKAIDSLENALLYNTSVYANITIKCNLMICYAAEKNISDAMIFFKELKNIIASPNNISPDIFRKINMNFAYVYYQQNDIKSVKKIIQQISDEIKGTSSEYKISRLLNINNTVSNSKYFDALYDPWILTLTHD